MDNCLMVFFENGFNELMVRMMRYLDDNDCGDIKLKLLAMKNYVNDGQTILMRLCKAGGNEEILREILKSIKDKENAKKLLDHKDDDGKCCFDYASEKLKENLLNSERQ